VRKSDYQITGSMSVGAWVKIPSTITSWRGIISKDATLSTHQSFRINYKTDGLIYFNLNGNDVASMAGLADTNWHYIVATNNGTTANIYLDGAIKTTGSGATIADTDAVFVIGGIGTVPAGWQWVGSIDEPFITTEVLTAAQIFDMYNSGR
ncbi:MAG: LamG-like jellyroll fold domain-containing protein, partial [Candidatus Roizmanbacteria bacterium]